MSTVLTYVIIRTTNKINQPVVTRIMSRWSQNPEDQPFFADESKKWHLVANPFYRGIDDMAMIIAEIDRDYRTTVKIVSEPRQQMADAQRDLRSLMAEEMRKLASNGNMTLHFTAGTDAEAAVIGDRAVFQHGVGLLGEWIRYTIRMASTEPYKVNDKYYMIVGYSTTRDIRENLLIDTGFYLYPTSYNKVKRYYDHLSTKKRPDFKYTHATTPSPGTSGIPAIGANMFPASSRSEVWIAYYAAAGGGPDEQRERRKELIEIDLPRITQQYALQQAEGLEMKKESENGVIMQREDGLNVWIGVLDMNVKYSDTAGDRRLAPGSGKDAAWGV